MLGLISDEGVETVLLRIEILIEGGLDKQVNLIRQLFWRFILQRCLNNSAIIFIHFHVLHFFQIINFVYHELLVLYNLNIYFFFSQNMTLFQAYKAAAAVSNSLLSGKYLSNLEVFSHLNAHLYIHMGGGRMQCTHPWLA